MMFLKNSRGVPVMNRGSFLFTVFVLLMLLLSGCGKIALSSHVDNDNTMNLSELTDGTFVEKVQSIDEERYLALCTVLRENFKMIMVISVFVGVLIYRVFKFDRGVQQFALFVLIIGIPVFIYVLTYGVCYFYGILYC